MDWRMKMVNENYTDITFVLDKSASMSDCVSDTIGGFNKFMKKQKGGKGKCRITTYLFDKPGSLKKLHNDVPITEIPQLTAEQYVADGWSTAYLDALGKTIDETGYRLVKMDEKDRPGKVLFVVLTDGLENASIELNREQVAKKLDIQENNYDWDFVFLGANFDAVGAYGGMLKKTGRSFNYSKDETGVMFEGLSHATSGLRCASLLTKNKVNFAAIIEDAVKDSK